MYINIKKCVKLSILVNYWKKQCNLNKREYLTNSINNNRKKLIKQEK